jgi:hypothetical protein
MGQPPRQWAVSGMPVNSPTLLSAKPLTSAAMTEAASEVASIRGELGELQTDLWQFCVLGRVASA